LYPPKHFQEPNIDKLLQTVKQFPLATLISVHHNTPYITHLPLIFKEDVFYGHIDKNNPHNEFLTHGAPVTLIFSGPQSYISPSLFESNQLPTFNYVKVHVKGNVSRLKTNAEIKSSIVEMTDALEAPNFKYRLAMDNEKMDNLVNYISGFKIENLEWEGKFKLSQDKTKTEYNIAKAELLEKNKYHIDTFIKTVLNDE